MTLTEEDTLPSADRELVRGRLLTLYYTFVTERWSCLQRNTVLLPASVLKRTLLQVLQHNILDPNELVSRRSRVGYY